VQDGGADDDLDNSNHHYALRSGGKLPTPDASQDTATKKGVPSRSSSVASSVAASDRPGAADPYLADDENDDEDNIVVASSRTVSPEHPDSGAVILGLDELKQNEDASVDGHDEPPHSPASTQIVFDTPLLPTSHARSMSAASSDATVPASFDLGDEDNESDSHSIASLFSSDDDDEHFNPDAVVAALNAIAEAEPHTPNSSSSASTPSSPSRSRNREVHHLRASRRRLTHLLIRSTTIINRLLAQTSILQEDLSRSQADLNHAQIVSRDLRRLLSRDARAGLRSMGSDRMVVGTIGVALGLVMSGVAGWMRERENGM
jgi:hypothetical protein